MAANRDRTVTTGDPRRRRALPDRRALAFFMAGLALVVAAMVVRLPWRLIGLVLVAVLLGRMLLGRRVRMAAFAAGVILPVMIAGVALFGRPAWEERAHLRPFEAAAWRKGGGRNPMWPVRLTMVDDLVRSHDLRGLTRAEATSLLGPPDEETPFRDRDMVWHLGPERGLVRISSEWLALRLGPDGKVRDIEVLRGG